MIARALHKTAFSDDWGRQMRFIAGPRQSGKTTLGKQALSGFNAETNYYLWDLREVREHYKRNELFFTAQAPPGPRKQWICFDEIHKMPKWKNILKGIYDASSDNYNFIITGSAKLDLMRRSGDSLTGRYFIFRLFPLILCEVNGTTDTVRTVPESGTHFIRQRLDSSTAAQEAQETLLRYGGFPEPFLAQSEPFLKKWSQDYLDTVIREDIGQLTRIIDYEYLFDLYRLLPAMSGSPVSESSLAGHLQVSPPTVKNYLRTLSNFYLQFSVRPYAKNIKRSLLRAAKVYFFDWTRIAPPGARFENYVACELNARTHLWTDASGERFDLFYIRNRMKQETDFLVTRNDHPWMLVECKLQDRPVERHHRTAAQALGGIPVVQVCRQDGIGMLQHKDVYRISASRFFAV